jgi:hypothetical protein
MPKSGCMAISSIASIESIIQYQGTESLSKSKVSPEGKLTTKFHQDKS